MKVFMIRYYCKTYNSWHDRFVYVYYDIYNTPITIHPRYIGKLFAYATSPKEATKFLTKLQARIYAKRWIEVSHGYYKNVEVIREEI